MTNRQLLSALPEHIAYKAIRNRVCESGGRSRTLSEAVDNSIGWSTSSREWFDYWSSIERRLNAIESHRTRPNSASPLLP